MRGIFGLVLVLGVALAGFAVFMINQYLQGQSTALQAAQRAAAQAPVTMQVYALTRPVTYGDLLTADDVRLVPYVRDYLPEGYFASEQDLFSAGLDVPRVVVLPMQRDEIVLAAKVTEPGASRGLTALVAPGMRAFPIQGRIASGFGVLRPEDRIDVYWTGRLRDGREVTNLIKSGVEIMAVTGDANARGGPQSMVVEVTPEDVALLTQAQNSGYLTLSLVGTGDVQVTDRITVDNSALTGEFDSPAVPAAPAAPERGRCFVTQRSGTSAVQVEVECSR
jgi:pilus assembly protein CpaB